MIAYTQKPSQQLQRSCSPLCIYALDMASKPSRNARNMSFGHPVQAIDAYNVHEHWAALAKSAAEASVSPGLAQMTAITAAAESMAKPWTVRLKETHAAAI